MSEQGMSSQEEYLRWFRERSRRLNEAIEAARSAARGMSRAEARQRVVAELRARGIVMPPSGIDLICTTSCRAPVQPEAYGGPRGT